MRILFIKYTHVFPYVIYYMISQTKVHPLLKIVRGALYGLPSPANIRAIWNFGSLLGACLGFQIITGLFLAIHYCGDTSLAFIRVRHISRDVNYGWILRILHANGARIFFVRLFLHVGRGIYYGSYFLVPVWIVGVVILLIVMATAFLGYVLPWGQISFWGATVITNLFSAIPYIGEELVQWIWGGFAVDNATLLRFFSLHFILPFAILGIVLVHLLFLHQTGRNNPLGLNRNFDKITFHPYFSLKDLFGLLIITRILTTTVFFYPWDLGDPENFLPANSLVTPVHIQPEWYFLIAYAILRSIPNKLGGVIALALSIIILVVCPFVYRGKFKRLTFYPINQIIFWMHINVWILLTWLGARPVEEPYVKLGQIFSIIYFIYYFLSPFVQYIWDIFLTY